MPGIFCARRSQGAAATRTAQRQWRGAVCVRRNVQPQSATRNRGDLGCGMRVAGCGLRAPCTAKLGTRRACLSVADASRNPQPGTGTERGKNQRTLISIALQQKVCRVLYVTQPPRAATFTPLGCKGGLGLQGAALRRRPCNVHVCRSPIERAQCAVRGAPSNLRRANPT